METPDDHFFAAFLSLNSIMLGIYSWLKKRELEDEKHELIDELF